MSITEKTKMILAADELFYNFPSERGRYLVYNNMPLTDT